ncbi:MAG: alcohol dehydrogenase [Acidobacteria bacterium]|nr:MAG: alcohol dehydrogenase [Acidobacteriota bacterium]
MTQTTCRAAVLEAPRRLEIREFPLPETREDDGILKVEACGLCGSDHEQYTGALPARMPVIPGHETVGIIEEIGPLASKRWGVKAGDRVAVVTNQSCRECENCRAGNTRYCPSHGIKDAYGFTPIAEAPSLWGGYAEYQYLAPDTLVYKIPDSLTPAVATLFNPVGAGIRWGKTLPNTAPGDVVAVMGPGIRGLAVAAAAREAGAGFVMITGVGPRDSDRLELAMAEFGADLAIDITESDPVAALRKAAGGLADVVVDVTARAPAALAGSIALSKIGGKIVVAGTRGSTDAPGFMPDMIVYKELTILGAFGVDGRDFEEALELLGSNKYPFAVLPRRCASLDEAPALLESMAGESDEPPPVHGVITP